MHPTAVLGLLPLVCAVPAHLLLAQQEPLTKKANSPESQTAQKGKQQQTIDKAFIRKTADTVLANSGPWEELQKKANPQNFLRPLTALGSARVDNVIECTTAAIEGNIPGDFVETGIFHGGASAIMASALKAAGKPQDRALWCADSFKGLPPNTAKDQEMDKKTGQPMDLMKGEDKDEYKNSLERVKGNFKALDVLDVNVHFLEGWFNETVPSAPIKQIAVLRLDGDSYSSTMDVLKALYTKVSPGGYVIIDDYGYWPQCKAAVNDYFASINVQPSWKEIDGTGVYWQRPTA